LEYNPLVPASVSWNLFAPEVTKHMDRRYVNFILILILVAGIVWVDLPHTTGVKIGEFQRSLNPVLGLDLRGGMQVLLAPQAGITASAQELDDTAKILENRANGLGVSEVVFQVAGSKYIIGEFPGLTNTADVIASVKQTGLLEFVDAGPTYLPPGTVITTDHELSTPVTNDGSVVPSVSSDGKLTPPDYVFHTIMVGSKITDVSVTADSAQGGFVIPFKVTPDSTEMFKTFTSSM
jgi:preprotein translocase subunit SecD